MIGKSEIMKTKKSQPPKHVLEVLKALKRASKLARKVSQATGTPFIYMRDGKIIKEIVSKS